MPRTDRMFRLLTALRSLPAPVTAARLAQATEVSQRTLYRDIDTLRAGGALIDGAPGYGYRLVEDTALPPQTFTRDEIEALVLGLGEVPYKGDAGLTAAAETALSKIIATLPERQQRQAMHAVVGVHRWRPPVPVRVDLGVVRQASWDERALDLVYRDAEGAETARRIWPLSVVCLEQTVAVLAWCCLRQDFRQFIAARIVGIAPTDESFRPRRVALLREYLARLRGGPSQG